MVNSLVLGKRSLERNATNMKLSIFPVRTMVELGEAGLVWSELPSRHGRVDPETDEAMRGPAQNTDVFPPLISSLFPVDDKCLKGLETMFPECNGRGQRAKYRSGNVYDLK
jgi:hypothetical protein